MPLPCQFTLFAITRLPICHFERYNRYRVRHHINKTMEIVICLQNCLNHFHSFSVLISFYLYNMCAQIQYTYMLVFGYFALFANKNFFTSNIYIPHESRFTYMTIWLNMTNTVRFNKLRLLRIRTTAQLNSYPMKVGFAFRASAVAGSD